MTATKTKAASPKQKAVLDALNGGRKVAIVDGTRGKTVTLTTPSNKPVKDAPKLDRGAVEACQKHGWVNAAGEITEDGKAAKKAAAKAMKTV